MEVINAWWFHFKAKGHRNVTANHRTTLEITKDDYLTPRGDCIVGVSSEASASDLPQWLRESLRDSNTVVVVVLCSGGVCDSLTAKGDPRISASNTNKIIIRKSNYVEESTIGVRSNKAAKDLRRDLVTAISSGHDIDVYITALPTARTV